MLLFVAYFLNGLTPKLTFTEFVNLIGLTGSKKLLKTGYKIITETCFQGGLESISYF